MNMYAHVARSYQRNAVDTGSPVHLIVLLYDGAIKFFRMSARAHKEGKDEEARYHLLRAEKIVLELLHALNFEQGGEIAVNLAKLYRFIIGRCAELTDADYERVIEENCRILSGLREAWVQVAQRVDGHASS
ncbi:flagellar export chaperone FliS [Candidatus Caldatribacterium sp.]|uniref:flagellar export chaperone FliS n=1 Tax=Candidatus Caldatribacterium sp. TaxID=2282143 RepID=UPI002997C88C|nr:flagellar export chaperone FliS [Candidatus Caldatribacterium sp.]MDW8082028.1 flagellar export chaperone FliS [Candidatus Calescibacterium sp.]